MASTVFLKNCICNRFEACRAHLADTLKGGHRAGCWLFGVHPLGLVITHISVKEFLTETDLFLKLANGSNPVGVACV